MLVFFVWLFGQFTIGYLFNEFLICTFFLNPLLIIGLLRLSPLTAIAHNIYEIDQVLAP
jgi:hypothetical protein